MGADPISWTIMGLSLASQVAGGIQSANAADKAKSQAESQAAAATQQAEANAQLIETQTARDKEQAAADARRNLARASVALSSAGVSSGTGSALEILSGAAADATRDMAWLDYEGRLKAAQARAQGQSTASNYAARAATAASRRSSAYSDLLLNGTSSLLSLGSRAYS